MATLENDIQKLVESATDNSGILRIRIISPGWGSSGYYSPEVLRDAAPLYKKGLHCYWNHPSKSEDRDRPERSLSDLAGILAEDAQWSTYPDPGVYARVQVFAPYRAAIKEMAPHIGISHRAAGTSKQGSAEGRSGTIIEKIGTVLSVDFVTMAGRGGAILESARREVADTIARADLQEDSTAALYHGFRALGLSEEAAQAAAGTVEDPLFLEGIDRQLYDGFRRFGFDEVEARAAAIPRDGQVFALMETRGLDDLDRQLYDGFRRFGLSEAGALAAIRRR